MTEHLQALPKAVRLYGHTLTQLEPAQVLGMAERTTRNSVLTRLPLDFDGRYDAAIPQTLSVATTPVKADLDLLQGELSEATVQTFQQRSRQAADGNLTFLNRSIQLRSPDLPHWFDDRFDDYPLLWPLKLYAFDPLRWATLGFKGPQSAPDRVVEVFDQWVRDWADSIEIGQPGYLRNAWTPWAVSLRIQTLVRYLAWRTGGTQGTVPEKLIAALAREIYRSSTFLENHVEGDVGGNHLIENGLALLMAGLTFPESDQSWISDGISILGRTGAKQFLSDGGHYERSPMYHAIVTTRYVTACSVLAASDRTVPTWLTAMTRQAVAYLRYLCPPDEQIPMCNDAVFGQALPLTDCLEYAGAAGFEPTDRPAPAHSPASGESGYYWLDTDHGRLLVDGGPVGPPHLPGHSHNDMLSVLLWVDGHRVLTDTGVYDYASNERRQYVRSVAGHNTVQVGDTEPIEIGGKYLMGARTEPTVRYEDTDPTVFNGRYETDPHAPASYQHSRAIVAADDWWLVRDTLRGPDTETEPSISRLHFHPDIGVTIDESGTIRVFHGTVTDDDPPLLSIHPLGTNDVRTTTTEYFPEFGVAQERQTVELRSGPESGATALGYLLSPGASRGDISGFSSDDDITANEIQRFGSRIRPV
ncbi:heparinase II/III family protein [Haloarcula sp. NS06]|uniref:heparinase II/III family protein n=1 Tax=unclassified Haloarcula TaxID=2624677 RepID=UPI0027AED149|nr:alginate lyase family protein [Haloarcula sp. H-GB4]MDQ2074381.1 alginate lyase family protein [Haloarcula sp. H-GB4]